MVVLEFASTTTRHFKQVLNGLTLLFCISILCILLHQMRSFKATKIHTTIKSFSIISVLFYCISLSSLLYASIINDTVYWFNSYYGICVIFWAAANSNVYILFMIRIRLIFVNTIYSPRICIYVSILTFVIIYFLCELMIGIFELFFPPTNELFQVMNIIFFVELISDFIVSIWLISLFLNKLIKVLMTQMKHGDDIKSDSMNLDRQSKLLKLITKQTILSSFGTVSTQIWLFYSIFLVVVFGFYKNASYPLKFGLEMFSDICCIFDCTVNSLVILLAFDFLEKKYYRPCCHRCHKCCVKCCLKCVENKRADLEMESLSQLQTELLLNNQLSSKD